MDHRIEPHALGLRDLTQSVSARMAADGANLAAYPIDFAELHTPYAHQEGILRRAMAIDDGVRLNSTGGALTANPEMVSGLIRIGDAASRIHRGEGRCGLAHAASGPCMQQNLICVLEGDHG